jgi:hypothetical protein
VKPPDAKDWVFLGDLPEFVEAFKRFETPAHIRQREARWRVAIVLLAVMVMLGLVLFRLVHHYH